MKEKFRIFLFNWSDKNKLIWLLIYMYFSVSGFIIFAFPEPMYYDFVEEFSINNIEDIKKLFNSLFIISFPIGILYIIYSKKINHKYNIHNEHDIDNKLRILKEEIDSDILQKLSGKTDKNLEDKLKQLLDEKLDMNIVAALGERVQSVSSDFALAKRLSYIVEKAYERIARSSSGYHDIYERFLKSYRLFGMLFAVLGVGVPSVCLWSHIEHIIHNDISYLEKFTYHIYLPIIPFTFLCVSLSIIMFSLSSKAQEKVESYTKELNTLLMKATGARLLIETTDKKQMIKAGEKFMEVERNFVLKKGERTIEQGNNELNLSLLEKQNSMMMSFMKELGKLKKET